MEQDQFDEAPPGGRWGDGYAMVPGWLLARTYANDKGERCRPSGNALLVYVHLAMHGKFDHATGVYDQCRPRVSRLADGDPESGYPGTGLSGSSINRALRELRKLGAIRGTPRFGPDGAQLPTVYRVYFGRVAPPDEAPPMSPVTGGDATGDRGGHHQQQGGATTGGRGGTPPVVDNPEPSTQNQPPTPPAAAPAAGGVDRGGRGDPPAGDPTDPASPSTPPDPPEPDRARLARELVDAVPDLSGAARGRLARRAARCLAAGHAPEAVQAELRGDLAGAGDPVAVLMGRLADLADTDPAPPRLVPRPRPPWCGQCDQGTRQRELEDGRPARCPRCHPLVVDPTAEVEYAPAGPHAAGREPVPTLAQLVDDPDYV